MHYEVQVGLELVEVVLLSLPNTRLEEYQCNFFGFVFEPGSHASQAGLELAV